MTAHIRTARIQTKERNSSGDVLTRTFLTSVALEWMRFTCCLCTCSSYAPNHPILHQRRSLSVLCLRVWQKLKNSPRETNFLCHSPAGGNGWFEPSSWLGLINELNFLEFRLTVQCSGMQKIKFKKKLHFEGLARPSFVIWCIFHIFDDIMSRHAEKTPRQSVE